MARKENYKRRLAKIAYQRDVCLQANMEQMNSILYRSADNDMWVLIEPDGRTLVTDSEIKARHCQRIVWLGIDLPTVDQLVLAKLRQKRRQRRQK